MDKHKSCVHSRITYRREIDGLRAVAVSAVVLYHAGVGPAAGYAGVDVFFVISGYLITALLIREHQFTGRIDLGSFYARRLRRILPASAFLIVSTLALSKLFLSPAEFGKVCDSAIAAIFFGANFFFQASTGGYFDPDSNEMPLLHLWSLAVEEQFYLLWPALLVCLLRLSRRILPILAALAAASFLLAQWLLETNPEAAFYQTPARFWELAAGGLIALSPRRPLPKYATALGLVLTVLAMCIELPDFPGWGALPAIFGAGLVVAAIHGGGTNRVLSSPPFVGLGLISFSLYLWHWPLLALFRATIPGDGSPAIHLAICAAAVMLSIAGYRYVEQPFRKAAATRSVVVAGIATMIVTSAFLLSVPRPSAADLAAVDKPPSFLRCNYSTDDDFEDFPKVGCESIPGQAPQVALWGDSMALAWQPIAIELGTRSGMSATDFSRDDCRPALGFVEIENQPADFRCREWNELVRSRVQVMDTVILAGRWQRALAPDRRAGFAESMYRTMGSLSAVRRVIVIGPSPELPESVPRCMRANSWAACAINRAQFLEESRDARQMLTKLVAAFPNAEYLDPSAWLCEADKCNGVKSGVPLYWDNFHISTSAARVYASQIPD